MTSFHIYHRHSFSQQFSTRYLFTIWCLLRSNISLIDRYVAPRLFAWKFDYSCRHTYYFIRIMRKLMMKTYRNILMWHVIRIWVVFECNWYRSVAIINVIWHNGLLYYKRKNKMNETFKRFIKSSECLLSSVLSF